MTVSNYSHRHSPLLATSILLAVCCSIVAYALVTSEDTLHWFLIPVLVSGLLIGRNAVAWALGQIDLYDPAALLSIVGFHFFFLAPILLICWGYRTRYVPALPDDFRPWVGGMAILNVLGLLLYRFLLRRYSRPKPASTVWLLNYRRFRELAILLLCMSAALQVWIFSSFGGIVEYMDARYVRGSFDNLGLVLAVSESFPIVAMMWFSRAMRRANNRSGLLLLAGFIAFVGLQVVFAVLWAAGLVHFFNRRLSRTTVFCGGLLGLAFMYGYGFYKDYGRRSVEMLTSAEEFEAKSARSHRTLEQTLIGDFSRTDIQAIILARTLDNNWGVQPAWGATYVGALALAVPRTLWEQRPPGKTRYLTELEYGPGSYVPGYSGSSHVAGLSGEAMINFGPAAVPLSLAVLAFVVGKLRSAFAGWHDLDVRRALLPCLVCAAPIVLVGDADNVIVFLVRSLMIPALLVCATATRVPVTVEKPVLPTANNGPGWLDTHTLGTPAR